MKYVAFILLALGFGVTMAQSPAEPSVVVMNGSTRIEGVDPFGAQVVVLYDKDMVKVYQERNLDGVTTFARFNDGMVVEYGTITKPLLVINKEIGDH